MSTMRHLDRGLKQFTDGNKQTTFVAPEGMEHKVKNDGLMEVHELAVRRQQADGSSFQDAVFAVGNELTGGKINRGPWR